MFRSASLRRKRVSMVVYFFCAEPLYYIPVFDTETEVYPELQEFDNGDVLLQLTDHYELMLHHSSILPPTVLIRTFKDGEPVDRIVSNVDITTRFLLKFLPISLIAMLEPQPLFFRLILSLLDHKDFKE